MKKRFISFIAFYATQLGDLMDIDDALTFVYADYCGWFAVVGGASDYSITASIQAWNVECAIQTEVAF